MSQSIRKIAIPASSDSDQILQKAKSEALCEEGATIRWITVNKGQRIVPSSATDALIINLASPGAVRVYDESDSLIGGVFIEDSTQTMVPWNSTWVFRASGSPRIAYIEKGQN